MLLNPTTVHKKTPEPTVARHDKRGWGECQRPYPIFPFMGDIQEQK